jgi:SAM-dependent methyltransferase
MTMTDYQPTRATNNAPSNCPQLESFVVGGMISPGLQAQVQALWPQERELIARYDLPADSAFLDVGCGTGEFELELARMWPTSSIIGLDVAPTLLDVARKRNIGHGNVAFYAASGAQLPFADETFDAVFCRHVLQAITNPAAVLDEMVRVLKPGGVLHLVPEDYGMVHDSSGARDVDRLWHAGWIEAGRNTGIDLCIGRKLPAMLLQRNLCDVQASFVVIDSLRVDRGLLKRLFGCWRDFANHWVAKNTTMHRDELNALFAGFLATLDDPDGYVVWQVPVISAVKPSDRASHADRKSEPARHGLPTQAMPRSSTARDGCAVAIGK